MLRSNLRKFAAALASMLATIALAMGIQLALGNFHTTLPHELYRAAQPDGAALARYQQEYGIRTVINLRGENAGAKWYDAELAASRQLGLTHLDFKMSSKRELTGAQAQQLVQMMRDAPKPILLHCMHGSDRTGLAAALYLLAISGADADTAQGQLSLRYGHLPLVINASAAMDRSFARLAPQFAHAQAVAAR